MSHTPTPWVVCRHLQSIEADQACKCGYRGGIWGGGGETLILEMGTDRNHDGWEMTPVADRPTQIADAQFIVRAVNAHDELVEALKRVFSDHGKVNSLEWTDKAAQALAKAGAL